IHASSVELKELDIKYRECKETLKNLEDFRTNEKASTQQQIQRFTVQLREKDEANQKLRERVAELSKELHDRADALNLAEVTGKHAQSTLEAKLKDTDNRIEDLKDELSKSKAALESCQCELAVIQPDRRHWRSRALIAEERVEELEYHSRHQEFEISFLSGCISSKESELDEAHRAVREQHAWIATLEDVHAKISAVPSEISFDAAALDAALVDRALLHDQILALQNQLLRQQAHGEGQNERLSGALIRLEACSMAKTQLKEKDRLGQSALSLLANCAEANLSEARDVAARLADAAVNDEELQSRFDELSGRLELATSELLQL
ncbi:hypothetical protein HDU91_004639, partial [Kappamyces sp. JEL0680]